MTAEIPHPGTDLGPVLVTGGASGIGAAVARRLASAGHPVVVLDLQDGAGEGVAAEVGGRFLHHDVTSVADWQANLAAALDRHGRVHALVNAAGILTGYPFDRPDAAAFAQVLAVNQIGVALGTQVVGAYLAGVGGGSVVNVASVAAVAPTRSPDLAYTSSKWGVRGVSRVAALALAAQGVRVNTVLPGLVDTPMLSSAGRPPEFREQLERSIPIGRIAEPDDIARAVAFFVSDLSRYCTGSELVVDGGLSA